MKSTKKIIIGLIAVLALLITIAGALAATMTSYNPVNNAVTVQSNQTQNNFSVTVTDSTGTLDYQWKVENVGVNDTVVDNTSTFTFDGTGKTVGQPYSVNVIVTEENVVVDSKTWTVNVQDPQPTSVLSITSIKVNGKTSGKLSLSDVNDVEVEVKNEDSKKMKDVVVTVRILDEDDDEVQEEESDEFDLSAGKKNKETLEFDFSNENVDEDEYTLEIEVEGEDGDGDDFSEIFTQTVEVDREKDDIIITKVDLQNSQVLCSAPQTSLDVHIKNVGENDQDGAKITVENAALGVNLQRANIDLDDYSGSDNDYEATFTLLNLEDAKQGTYTLDVSVYSEDDELMDSKQINLQLQCAEA